MIMNEIYLGKYAFIRWKSLRKCDRKKALQVPHTQISFLEQNQNKCDLFIRAIITWSCCEHHQYYKPTLSIMPLRALSTVGGGSHHRPHYLTSLNPTLTTIRLCLFISLHVQHQTPYLLFHDRWLRAALSPTSNIYSCVRNQYTIT